MNYKENSLFYKPNKKTGELEEVIITDVLYRLNKRIVNKNAFTKEELDDMISREELIPEKDIDTLKNRDIRLLEEKYGINLKEV